MSEHTSEIQWTRSSDTFDYDAYNREYTVRFDNGSEIKASAAVDFKGRPECVDPEEMLTAAIAGCHMLTFLAVASKKKFIVDSYSDQAIGYLEKNANGQLAVTRAVLRPKVAFGGEKRPTPQEINALHESAHRNCFIANSVSTQVTIEPVA